MKALLKVMNVFVIVVLLLPLTGCDTEKAPSSKKKLTMITSADYPPFEFYQSAGGSSEIVGFDIDLARRICDYLGMTLEIKDVAFPGIIPGIISKRADFAMAGISPTPERSKNISFSKVYYSNKNVFLTRKDSSFPNFKSSDKIQVMVQLGSVQEAFGKIWARSYPNVKIVSLNLIIDMVQELRSNRVEAVIMEKPIAEAFFQHEPEAFKIHEIAYDENEEDIGLVIAFPLGSPLVGKFDAALDHLEEIGFINELKKKWFTQSIR